MVSVIIRAHNRLEYTMRCLQALARDDEPHEAIVIDNASDDGTAEWLAWIARNEVPRRWFGEVKHVRLERNLGDFGGMVEGIRYARGDYLAQLDNDVEIRPGSLRLCRLILDSRHGAVVMPRRQGVHHKIACTKQIAVEIEGASIVCCVVPFCVMFYMLSMQDALRSLGTGPKNAREFTSRAGVCLKIDATTATQMEGAGFPVHGVDYAQYRKYVKAD